MLIFRSTSIMGGSRKFRWRGGVLVLTTFNNLVINVFHRGQNKPPWRSNWTQVQMLPRGVKLLLMGRWVSIPVFLRTCIATCYFRWGLDPCLPPSPLDPPMQLLMELFCSYSNRPTMHN